MIDSSRGTRAHLVRVLWLGVIVGAAAVLGLGACERESSDGDADGDVDLGCNDTCNFSDDGDCDDGGPDSDYSVCDFGTDCTDCGRRDPADCVPTCESEEGTAYACGSDGCFDVCGTCPDGQACNFERQCEDCEPDCSDGEGGTVECGDDGCGGTCGECGANEGCTWEGTCESCECSDGACGENACGEDCGDCPEGQVCSWEGICEVCEPDCSDGEGGTVECGDDGCGGSCGECGADQMCNDETRVCEAGDPMCNDTCRFADDGDCDDGGQGCDYSVCGFGSDCTDCGARTEADRLPEGEECSGGDDT